MVVHDLDVEGIAVAPAEADPVLVIYPDAVLAFAITLQGFQSVARRDTQVGHVRSGVQHLKFPSRHLADLGAEPTGGLIVEDFLRFPICPRLDHKDKYAKRIYVRQVCLSGKACFHWCRVDTMAVRMAIYW